MRAWMWTLALTVAMPACGGKDPADSGDEADADTDTDADSDTDADTDTDTEGTDADGDEWTVEGGDCDDGDASVNPDADEICDDGIDQNCDGASGRCAWKGDNRLDEVADASFTGGGGGAGYLVQAVGDLDGDGDDELAVTEPWAAPAGEVHVLRGPLAGELGTADAAVTLLGEVADDGAGLALAGATDLLGDGAANLVVGAPWHDAVASQAGRVYVFSGVPAGPTASLADADAIIDGSTSPESAGTELDGSGDLDGDGLTDLVVAAPQYYSGTDYGMGRVHVILGPLAAASSVDDASATWTGAARAAHAGDAITVPGDVDGDGRDDLLVGAWGTASEAGAAYILFDAANGGGSLTGAEVTIAGEAGEELGRAVSRVGDLVGDSATDVLVMASWNGDTGTGRAHVFAGPLAAGTLGSRDAVSTITGVYAEDSGLAAAYGDGDVDGDGRADLFLPAYNNGTEVWGSGISYLFHGPLAPGDHSTAQADARFFTWITSVEAGGQSGFSAAIDGDYDGDGRADIVVGAPEWGEYDLAYGLTWVMNGRGL